MKLLTRCEREGPRGVMVHGPRGDSYLCNNNVDVGTVIESGSAV